MLETGKNTYVTVAEADLYVQEHYRDKNALRAHWSVCSDEYKEQYLLKSIQEIEALPFVGRKTTWSQKLQFPRTLLNAPLHTRISPVYLLYRDSEREVPQCVKDAQIENALGIIRGEYRPASKAAVLSSLGLTPPEQPAKGRLSSEHAETLLKPFLGALRA